MPSPGQFIWSAHWGGSVTSSSVTPYGVDVGPDGNPVVVGTFGGTITFYPGGQQMTNVAGGGYSDIFVAKFNPATAQPLWQKHFGSAGQNIAYSAKCDSSGNVLVTGQIVASVDFGTGAGPIGPNGGSHIFLLKLSGVDGSTIWARVFASGIPASVVTDGGSTYTCIKTHLSNSFSEPGVGGGWQTYWILGGSGGSQWLASQTYSAANFGLNDAGFAISVDSLNDVIIGGYFGFGAHCSIDFGNPGTPIVLNNTGLSRDIFIAKFDSTGSSLWAKQYSTPQDEWITGIAVDKFDASIVFCGNMNSAVNFGLGPVTAYGGTDIFLARVDSSGNTLFSVGLGTNLNDTAASVAVDSARNIALVGNFAGLFQAQTNYATINFGNGVMKTNHGNSDMFVAKFNSAFQCQWANNYGQSGGVGQFNAVSTDSSNNLLTGSLVGFPFKITNSDGASTFLFPTGGATDALVVPYDTNGNDPDVAGNFVWPNGGARAGGSGANLCTGIAVNSNGTIYAVGSFATSIDFGGGAMSTAGGASHGFIVSFGSMVTTIAPPNPAWFNPAYAPSANTAFNVKLGWTLTSAFVLPGGAANVLIKVLTPAGTVNPPPGVETVPFLLLNYPATWYGTTAYGFIFKLIGGNGPVSGPGTTIQDWCWTAAWADANGHQISDWCNDGSTFCAPTPNTPNGWVHVNKIAAVNINNNGVVASTPYQNLKAKTVQTLKGPMQVISLS